MGAHLTARAERIQQLVTDHRPEDLADLVLQGEAAHARTREELRRVRADLRGLKQGSAATVKELDALRERLRDAADRITRALAGFAGPNTSGPQIAAILRGDAPVLSDSAMDLRHVFLQMAGQLEGAAAAHTGVQKARAVGGALAWREAEARLARAQAAAQGLSPEEIRSARHAILRGMWIDRGERPGQCRYCGCREKAADDPSDQSPHTEWCDGRIALAALGRIARRQAEARLDCHGGAGMAADACGACITCLTRALEAAESRIRTALALVAERKGDHRGVPALGPCLCFVCKLERVLTEATVPADNPTTT